MEEVDPYYLLKKVVLDYLSSKEDRSVDIFYEKLKKPIISLLEFMMSKLKSKTDAVNFFDCIFQEKKWDDYKGVHKNITDNINLVDNEICMDLFKPLDFKSKKKLENKKNDIDLLRDFLNIIYDIFKLSEINNNDCHNKYNNLINILRSSVLDLNKKISCGVNCKNTKTLSLQHLIIKTSKILNIPATEPGICYGLSYAAINASFEGKLLEFNKKLQYLEKMQLKELLDPLNKEIENMLWGISKLQDNYLAYAHLDTKTRYPFIKNISLSHTFDYICKGVFSKETHSYSFTFSDLKEWLQELYCTAKKNKNNVPLRILIQDNGYMIALISICSPKDPNKIIWQLIDANGTSEPELYDMNEIGTIHALAKRIGRALLQDSFLNELNRLFYSGFKVKDELEEALEVFRAGSDPKISRHLIALDNRTIVFSCTSFTEKDDDENFLKNLNLKFIYKSILQNTFTDRYGGSAFHLACLYNDFNFVKKCFDIFPDAKTYFQESYRSDSALKLAVMGNNYEIANFLLQKNINFKENEKYASNALHCACFSFHQPTIKLLLEKDANLFKEDCNGYTPADYLLFHCKNGRKFNKELLVMLIDRLGPFSKKEIIEIRQYSEIGLQVLEKSIDKKKNLSL